MSHLIITVDVESRSLPVDSAYRLLDILDEFKVKALFFISIMDKPAVDLGLEAQKRGHDLGLHTHGCGVWHGSNLFKKSFGFLPEVFRVGAYRITQKIIIDLFYDGIKYDWSLFPYHPNCIDFDCIKINAPFERSGVVMLPITGYYRRNFRGMKFVKTDIDASTEDELWFYWRNMHGYIMNLFMHSYSLQSKKNEKKFVEFIKVMCFLKQVISFDKLKEKIDFKLPEKVPIYDESIFRFVKRQFQ